MDKVEKVPGNDKLGWMGYASEYGKELYDRGLCAWGGGRDPFCEQPREGESSYCAPHTARYRGEFGCAPRHGREGAKVLAELKGGSDRAPLRGFTCNDAVVLLRATIQIIEEREWQLAAESLAYLPITSSCPRMVLTLEDTRELFADPAAVDEAMCVVKRGRHVGVTLCVVVPPDEPLYVARWFGASDLLRAALLSGGDGTDGRSHLVRRPRQ